MTICVNVLETNKFEANFAALRPDNGGAHHQVNGRFVYLAIGLLGKLIDPGSRDDVSDGADPLISNKDPIPIPCLEASRPSGPG